MSGNESMLEMMSRDKRKRNSPMFKALLKDKPCVTPKMQTALNAFNSICRGRKYTGQYASPLPLTEHDVINHVNLNGFSGYEPDILIGIILALDNSYLEAEAARRKAETR